MGTAVRAPREKTPCSVRLGVSEHKGRGVFAGRDFREGELIESAPVIVIPAAQWPLLEHTVLHDYMYAYGPTLDDMAIALTPVSEKDDSPQNSTEPSAARAHD